jgi:tetratricopeptide (TPR) repeat protein
MLKFTAQLTTLVLLLFTGVFSLSAQDAAADAEPSAAAIYNDALGKVKEKAYEEALPLFEEAIAKADSTDDTGKKVISLAGRNGAVCAYRAGTTARKAGEMEKALDYYDRGVKLNGEYFGNHLGKAQTLEDMEDKAAEALAAYVAAGQAAEMSEDNADKAPALYRKAQNFSALAYIKEDDNEKAIMLADAYLEARGDAGDSYIASYYKASALNKLEKNEEALEAIQASIAALPEDEEADKYHLIHGLIQQALGNVDEAIAAYELVQDEKYKGAAESRIQALKQ